MSNRQFFQMHLSTAVVLMLVASVLVWANVRGQWDNRLLDGEFDPVMTDGFTLFYGWPKYYRGQVYQRFEKGGTIASFAAQRDLFWNSKGIYFDALIALAILLAVWQACERRIRRGSSQKSP